MSYATVNFALIQVIISCLAVRTVISYENAYDLFERRNQRFFKQPYYRTSETVYNYDNRGFNHKRNPHLDYSPLRQPIFNEFGNGYDNIGNGVPSTFFRPFQREEIGHQRTWRYDEEPFNRRPISRFNYNEYPYINHHHHHRHHNSHFNYYPRRQDPIYEDRFKIRNKAYGGESGAIIDSNLSKVDRFAEEKANEESKKADEIFLRSQEGVTKDSLRKENVGEHSHADQTGENKSSLRTNKVVKKGHTTKGFASHHHKDETGNTTTFFDESSDFGGQSDFKDINDGFGTRRTLEQVTNIGDEKFYSKNGGQNGNFGSGLSSGNKRFQKDFISIQQEKQGEANDHRGGENESSKFRKTFHYLNGDDFDFDEPYPSKYY